MGTPSTHTRPAGRGSMWLAGGGLARVHIAHGVGVGPAQGGRQAVWQVDTVRGRSRGWPRVQGAFCTRVPPAWAEGTGTFQASPGFLTGWRISLAGARVRRRASAECRGLLPHPCRVLRPRTSPGGGREPPCPGPRGHPASRNSPTAPQGPPKCTVCACGIRACAPAQPGPAKSPGAGLSRPFPGHRGPAWHSSAQHGAQTPSSRRLLRQWSAARRRRESTFLAFGEHFSFLFLLSKPPAIFQNRTEKGQGQGAAEVGHLCGTAPT